MTSNNAVLGLSNVATSMIDVVDIMGPRFDMRITPYDSKLPVSVTWRTHSFSATRTTGYHEERKVHRALIQLRHSDVTLTKETENGLFAAIEGARREDLDLDSVTRMLLTAAFEEWTQRWARENIRGLDKSTDDSVE